MEQFDVVINGRVLGLPLNGIPRYAMEICRGLDCIENLPFNGAIVVPNGTTIQYRFRQLKVIELPNNRLWDYYEAERFAQKNRALYISLASKGVRYKNSISMIHDIRPLVYGDGHISIRSLRTKLKFYISYKLSLKNARKIVTLSNFSKREIMNRSNVNDISVIGCGWEHIQRTVSDDTVFTEYPEIERGKYFFSVSSIAPHKNFSWIIENAEQNPNSQYVIVGKTDPSLWKDNTGDFDKNILYLGFQSDERVKALMCSAKALIFPSVYEGFGIPPLEALSCGIPAIVSDIPVMKEIFGESVQYIDPQSAKVDLIIDNDNSIESVRKSVLERYTWQATAKQWLALIEGIIKI